jgi:hypothetical protein
MSNCIVVLVQTTETLWCHLSTISIALQHSSAKSHKGGSFWTKSLSLQSSCQWILIDVKDERVGLLYVLRAIRYQQPSITHQSINSRQSIYTFELIPIQCKFISSCYHNNLVLPICIDVSYCGDAQGGCNSLTNPLCILYNELLTVLVCVGTIVTSYGRFNMQLQSDFVECNQSLVLLFYVNVYVNITTTDKIVCCCLCLCLSINLPSFGITYFIFNCQ